MPKKLSQSASRREHITLPLADLELLELLLYDSRINRPAYGAKSAVLSALLSAFLDAYRDGKTSMSILPALALIPEPVGDVDNLDENP